MTDKEMKTCKWVIDGNCYETVYKTECDNMFEFSVDGIKENEFIYCPYCGGKIIEEKKMNAKKIVNQKPSSCYECVNIVICKNNPRKINNAYNGLECAKIGMKKMEEKK